MKKKTLVHPRFFKYINILFIMHGIILGVFATEVFQKICMLHDAVLFYTSNSQIGRGGYIKVIMMVIEDVARYTPDNDNPSTAMLFSMWTIIMTLITFYLGRKEEKVYGIRNWTVISYSLSKVKMRLIVTCWFMDLFIIISATIITITWSKIVLYFSLGISFIYMFFVVVKGTSLDEIMAGVESVLCSQWEQGKESHNINEVECPYLFQFISNIKNITLTNLDYYISRFDEFFEDIIANAGENRAINDNYVILIESMFGKFKNKKLRAYFIQTLLTKVQKKATLVKESEQIRGRCLFPVILPMINRIPKDGITLLYECLITIEGEEVQKYVFINALVRILVMEQKENPKFKGRGIISQSFCEYFPFKLSENQKNYMVNIWHEECKENHMNPHVRTLEYLLER